MSISSLMILSDFQAAYNGNQISAFTGSLQKPVQRQLADPGLSRCPCLSSGMCQMRSFALIIFFDSTNTCFRNFPSAGKCQISH